MSNWNFLEQISRCRRNPLTRTFIYFPGMVGELLYSLLRDLVRPMEYLLASWVRAATPAMLKADIVVSVVSFYACCEGSGERRIEFYRHVSQKADKP